MSPLEALAQPAWQNLVIALLHTLWQGAVLGLVVYCGLRWFSARRAGARYLLALGGQVGILLGGLTTWAILNARGADRAAVRGGVAVVSREADRSAATADIGVPAIRPWEPNGRGEVSVANGPAVSSAGRGPAAWVPLAAAGWLAGVAFMLLRTVVSVAHAWQLGRGPRATDPKILDCAEQIRRQLRIVRRVRVVLTELCTSPAVLGVVWPTVVLPASMLTGLSPDSLRAVLAHELAHIRRHDYLLNLLGMAIESLLFFNPAVWWIGRQVRAEREACCDAMAVAVLGEPIGYSRALAEWSRRLPVAATPAVAWLGSGRRKPVLDRVRRMLVPGYRPEVPVSWSGLVVLLLLGPVVLAGLWRGTTVAVAIAAEILSPAERIEKMHGIEQAYGARPRAEAEPQGKFTISGQVRMEDGSPLPPKAHAAGGLMRPAYSGSVGIDLDGAGRFSEEIKIGTFYLHVHTPGFAIAIAGPFKPKAGETIENVDLVVRRGFSAQVRFVDPKGEPIEGVELENLDYRMPHDRGWNSYAHPLENELLPSDHSGLVTLERCSDWPLTIDARGSGYQFERREWKLKPGEVVTWPLESARPATGIVVAEEDERPVAGARLYVAQRNGYAVVSQDPRGWADKPLLAVSDAEGRFRLDTLRDGCRYMVYVEAEGRGVKLVRDVAAGENNLVVRLGPPLAIRGRLIGKLDELPREYRTKEPYFSYRNPIRMLDNSSYSDLFRAAVNVQDGVGTFEIVDLIPGYVELNPPGRIVRLGLEQSIEDLEIDLTKPSEEDVALANRPKRTVILAFELPEGSPPPRGKLRVGYTAEALKPRGFEDKTFEIERREMRMEVPAGSKLFYDGDKLLGYWIDNRSGIEVSEGEAPLRLSIPAIPAGAIYGRVLGADGEPAEQGTVHLITVEKPPELRFSLMETVQLERGDGRFAFSPVPLRGRYRVLAKARESEARALSEIATLDVEHPLVEFELKFAAGETLRGRVVAPDGRPGSGTRISFDYSSPHGTSYGDSDVTTDEQGRFAFDHVDPDLPGRYSLTVRPTETFRGRRLDVQDVAGPLTIRLKPGLHLSGVLIDAATREALVDTEVAAWVEDFRNVEYGIPVETRTDHQGHFAFKNLEPTVYRFRVKKGEVVRVEPRGDEARRFGDPLVVRAGRNSPVTVFVERALSAGKPAEESSADR